MNTAIPIDKHHWIDYKDRIFVIQADKRGTFGKFQYDGTSCYQGEAKGRVIESFTSGLKYFSPTFWYKKTSWGTNYPKGLFFDTKQDRKVRSLLDLDPTGLTEEEWDKKWNAAWDKVNAYADEHARPAENVLAAIIKNVNKNTGGTYSFPFNNTDYGVYWWEAYVPLVDDKGNQYLLTWQNCD